MSAASQPSAPRTTDRLVQLAAGVLDTVRRFAGVTLIFLPFAIIFDLAGYLPWYWKDLILAVILSSLGMVLQPRHVFRIVLPWLSWAVAGLTSPPLIPWCALWLLTWIIVSVPHLREPGRLIVAVTISWLCWLVLFVSPAGYPIVEQVTHRLCRAIGWFIGMNVNLGPTYLGLGALVFFGVVTFFADANGSRRWVRLFCFLIAAVAVLSLSVLVFLKNADFQADFTWKLSFRDWIGAGEIFRRLIRFSVLYFPFLLFIAYMLIFLVLQPPHRWISYEVGKRRFDLQFLKGVSWRTVVSCLVLVMLVCWFCPPTAFRNAKTRNFVFIEKGVVSFTKPDYQRFGRGAGGMYGLLPEYVTLFGCSANVVKEVPTRLDTNDVLVFTNLDEPLSKSELERIWNFVRAGGGLWVLGDHTFIKNGRNHINDLLAPVHIRLNHDSAEFFPQGWFHSYRLMQGTCFSHLFDPAENRLAILVGASLEVRHPAFPLILGRFGYGDLGVERPDPQRGYLGDFRYQPDERLGDLVLVAGEVVDRGKVLVFGDTTSFFNANLPRSYTLLRAALSYFGQDPVWDRPYSSWRPMAYGFAMVALVLIFLFSSREIFGLACGLIVGLSVILLGGPFLYNAGGQISWHPEQLREKAAVIDFSHQPLASKHSSMPEGLHGLKLNLMRGGLLPLIPLAWEPALIQNTRLVVLPAPRKKITSDEAALLHEYLEQGGIVWLNCGFHERKAVASFLGKYRLEIGDVPLGRFFDRPAFGQNVSFFSAWPVLVYNNTASLICVYGDLPVMVYQPVGKGVLVVIGDSEFFHNRNLETLETYDPNNVLFIRNLITYCLSRTRR